MKVGDKVTHRRTGNKVYTVKKNTAYGLPNAWCPYTPVADYKGKIFWVSLNEITKVS